MIGSEITVEHNLKSSVLKKKILEIYERWFDEIRDLADEIADTGDDDVLEVIGDPHMFMLTAYLSACQTFVRNVKKFVEDSGGTTCEIELQSGESN